MSEDREMDEITAEAIMEELRNVCPEERPTVFLPECRIYLNMAGVEFVAPTVDGAMDQVRKWKESQQS